MQEGGSVEDKKFLKYLGGPYRKMCCCSLRTGSYVIATLDSLSGLVAFVFLASKLSLSMDDIEKSNSEDYDDYTEDPNYKFAMSYPYLYVMLEMLSALFATAGLIMAPLGIYGLRNQKFDHFHKYSIYKIVGFIAFLFAAKESGKSGSLFFYYLCQAHFLSFIGLEFV